MDDKDREIMQLKNEISILKEQLHNIHMKMSDMKVILNYEVPVCREKLMECLSDSAGCKEGFDKV